MVELRRRVGGGVESILRPDLRARHDLQSDQPLVCVTGQVDDRSGWPLEEAVDPELARQLPSRI